jgi:hypothetical protein
VKRQTLNLADIKLDKEGKRKLLEEMNEDEKCLWELQIMYPEKVKIFFKKELEERLRMLHPEEEHLSAEELQKISIDRLY